MDISAGDREVLRSLAGRYGEIAHLDIQRERIERYYNTNDLVPGRPVVLIDEIPWGEIRDDEMVNRCAPELAWIETRLRQSLYQWEHFQVDLVIPPVFRFCKSHRSTGFGLQAQDTALKGDTGAYIAAHEYADVLKTEADLEKLQLPVITRDDETTGRNVSIAEEVFRGLMPVEAVGTVFQFNIWDLIARYRGVDSLLMDLVMRPEFMHQTARRFMEIGQAILRQYAELELLHVDPLLLHCTPACTRDLPADDFDGKVRPRDTWGRCSAQIFGSVSPDMHDEFDLVYNQELFGECGLLYYGCCEPMDRKIDILRKRFPNLRKVSITPWADAERAAENMGSDYAMAAKPNPAFVSSKKFNPTPVEEEIIRYVEACRRHGTTYELVLKDVSTIANNPDNLTQWAATVNGVLDRYYG